jgi:membrane protease YdiL (CAAX protease family)
VATLVQAVIFASWHVGITYTPFVLLFIALYVFPLGLLAGYLTRSSGSILPGWLFHIGVDMAITCLSCLTSPESYQRHVRGDSPVRLGRPPDQSPIARPP